MSAAIAAGAARRGAEKRKAMEAERKAEEKCKADAEKALKKLQAATTPEALSDALRRGTRLKAYLPELKKAIPEAEKRLKEMTANAEKGDIDEFLARVEAAAKRDEAGGNSMDVLKGYFKDLFADNDEDGDSCLNFEEFKQAMEIVAPNFGVAELKGAFHASDTDGSGGVDKDEFMKRVSMFQQMSEDMDNAGAGAGTAAPPSAASEKNLMQLTAEERKEAEMLFQKYDKDKSGELDFAEFRKVMRIIAGEGLSDANMLKAFEQCDQDGTGNIDYQEFLAGQTELKKWKQKRKPKKK